MKLYLIKDYYRVEGETGAFVEQECALARYDESITLLSARNQMVSFQLVVQTEPEETLRDFQIELTPLSGDGGIVPADYEMFIEWYHRINGKLMPDLLIPYEESKLPFRVPLDPQYHKNQRAGALWIDLWVPQATTPGRYAGTITATADGRVYSFHIKLSVYDCTVPSESLMMADLNNYADNISPSFPHLRNHKERYQDGSYDEVEREFYRISREHRALFENLNYLHSGQPVESFAPQLEGSGKHIRVKSWEAFDRHFGPYLDGSAFEGSRRGAYPIEFMLTPFNMGWPAHYEKYGQKGYKTEFRRILWEYMHHFEEMGWTKTINAIMFNHKKHYRFFPSNQDEIWYEHDEEVFDYLIEVMKDTYEHSAAKFVLRADSSNHFGNHFERYGKDVGLWVAAMTMFSWFPESVLSIRNNGGILWIYGWFKECMPIELPLHASLTQPMVAYMTGATGFCSFWNAVSWGEDYLQTPLVNAGQTLFYPGFDLARRHVLPSIRLKVLRNHMQMVDLMMTADGIECEAATPLRKELEEVVNKCYGYENNDAWWQEKPDFLQTAPRYWKLENYQTNTHYERHSPKLVERLRRGVLTLLGG